MTSTIDHTRVHGRAVRLLFGTQIIGGVGVAVGIAVGVLLLDDLTGGPSLSGLGSSASVIGGALLAIPIVRITNRFGRRGGLSFAYLTGVAGALIIVLATIAASVPLAFAGMLAFGGGTAAGLQARYAAVDLAAEHQRGKHLSLVVWATTLGSVSGPSLAPFADTRAQLAGLPVYAGPFLGSAIGFAIAAVALLTLLRPDPLLLARQREAVASTEKPGMVAGWRIIRVNAAARIGVFAVALGHLVMVAVMAMTPIHIKHGIGDPSTVTTVVGIILSLHIAGMYALSPVAGWAADRFGPRYVILAGIATLVVACVLAGTAGHGHGQLAAGLILLGLGWSGTMVGGSALLTAAVSTAQRPAVQGLSDFTMGCAGAAAGAVSGFIVESAGYPVLAACAAAAVLPVTVLVMRTRLEGS